MSSNSYSAAVPLILLRVRLFADPRVPGGQLRRDVEGTYPGLTQPNTVSQHTSLYQEYADSASLLAVIYLIRIRNVRIIAGLVCVYSS